MLVGSDRSVAAILPPGCTKIFTTPTTPTVGVIDLRPKASMRSISKIFGALAPKGGAGQGFVAFEEFSICLNFQPKKLFVYKFW